MLYSWQVFIFYFHKEWGKILNKDKYEQHKKEKEKEKISKGENEEEEVFIVRSRSRSREKERKKTRKVYSEEDTSRSTSPDVKRYSYLHTFCKVQFTMVSIGK